MEFKLKNAETETLQRLHSMINYSEWIYDLIKPHIEGAVLELGCGIGAMTRHILGNGSPIISVDINESHINSMESLFGDVSGIEIHCLDILEDDGTILKPSSFDTVMLINVLEHIKKESEFLSKINELLKPGGKFILLVPAYEWLFGTLDIIVGHERRYSKQVLVQKLHDRGFEPVLCKYMNSIGIFGWWLNGKVFKKKEFSVVQIRNFERLIPLIARFEKLVPLPFGQSILVVSEKTR